jgi:hypothetical protein
MWKSEGNKARVQKKKTRGKQSSKLVPDARLKGKSAAARLEYWARRISETFSHTRACPDETGDHPRDALIPAEYGNLQRLCVVISNGHVRHNGRDTHASTSSAFTTSSTTTATTTTTTATPAEHSQATTATMKLKSP